MKRALEVVGLALVLFGAGQIGWPFVVIAVGTMLIALSFNERK